MCAGLSAYASLLGFFGAGAAEFAGQVPLILKLNSHDLLYPEQEPLLLLCGKTPFR